jgi:hypothetical protein
VLHQTIAEDNEAPTEQQECNRQTDIKEVSHKDASKRNRVFIIRLQVVSILFRSTYEIQWLTITTFKSKFPQEGNPSIQEIIKTLLNEDKTKLPGCRIPEVLRMAKAKMISAGQFS